MSLKYLAEYRDPAQAQALCRAIQQKNLRPIRLMEVCGTHTMAIFRFGLRDVLPQTVDLLSGPGCPVCVTSLGEIDRAVCLARMPGVIMATFGDMIRVPGSGLSLGQAKAEGARVEVVYSIMEALELARQNPEAQVVFLGIGFETTAPTVAAGVIAAADQGLTNFSILSCHKTLPPALEALLASPDLDIDGLLMPGHVTTIIGAEAYRPAAERFKIPCVVCGFEPLDILQSILMLVEQIEAGRHEVEIQYRRGAGWQANGPATAVLNQAFRPTDAVWRGLGPIPGSGLALAPDFTACDAAARFGLEVPEAAEPPGCQCGQVLRGAIKPPDCRLFRTVCDPENPVGPCMVSSEGTCQAYFKYHLV